MTSDPAQGNEPAAEAAAACPKASQLEDFAHGRLDDSQAASLQAHFRFCIDCGNRYAALSETAPDANKPASRTTKPERFDYPEMVAEFRLLRLLGQGAMGQVFAAHDTFLDRTVALKFLPTLEARAAARERFYVEARAVARLQHPNVVTLYRAGEENGRPYLVSELVRGRSLDHTKKPVDSDAVLNIALGIARGLAAAHRHGVLHRDIKPANVIMGKDGIVKILDFGLAKLVGVVPAAPLLPGTLPPAAAATTAAVATAVTAAPPAPPLLPAIEELHAVSPTLTRSGAMLGTPLYMSPESWQSAPATPQSDVYSLGVMIFELCCGHPPHLADTAIALGWRVISKDAPSLAAVAPGTSPGLAAIVDRCLRRNPAERFASGEELCQALERLQTKPPPVPRGILFAGLFLILLALSVFAGLGLRRLRQAQRQTELAQKLGQQIKDMEWLLRSARQLPLHDLEREKSIIRKRMTQLQTELGSYGALGRGLAHYAIGRGHMALHEYPEALTHLQQAIADGNQRAEVRYSLGFVLGKHFEQAMYEARLSGGGDWANKQLREIEPKYLTPAIASLQSSRAMKVDAPLYLEGLIAFYQRDYAAALQHADAAFREAPWLYEAPKLSGDIHLEQARKARDSGQYEEAEREFTAAVASYETAAAIGQSDAEVYEGLAEAWVRQIEMAANRGKPTEAMYAAAVAASDKLTRAEPESIGGQLKKGLAALMTMAMTGAGVTCPERVKQCLAETSSALQKDPGNPYASDVAAACNLFAADGALAQGEDPELLLRKALSLLEGAIARSPKFLWGLNDLANAYSALGGYFLLHGNPLAKGFLEKSLEYARLAASLDATYIQPMESLPATLALLLFTTQSAQEEKRILQSADDYFARCIQINKMSPKCYINHFVLYSRAAQRSQLSGEDVQLRLSRAYASLLTTRQLGASFLNVEQYAALAYLVDAGDRVKRQQDPGPVLPPLQAALKKCLALAAKNAMCQTLDAQSELLLADWLARQGKPALAVRKRALEKSLAATQGTEVYPDAWQTLAESYLRLADSKEQPPAVREQLIASGLDAVATLFALNPRHAQGLFTAGSLHLLRARSQLDAAARRKSAQQAVTALTQAGQSDPLLTAQAAPVLIQAQALAAQ